MSSEECTIFSSDHWCVRSTWGPGLPPLPGRSPPHHPERKHIFFSSDKNVIWHNWVFSCWPLSALRLAWAESRGKNVCQFLLTGQHVLWASDVTRAFSSHLEISNCPFQFWLFKTDKSIYKPRPPRKQRDTAIWNRLLAVTRLKAGNVWAFKLMKSWHSKKKKLHMKTSLIFKVTKNSFSVTIINYSHNTKDEFESMYLIYIKCNYLKP